MFDTSTTVERNVPDNPGPVQLTTKNIWGRDTDTIFLRRFIYWLQVSRRIRKNIYLDSPRRVLTRPALCQFLDYGWRRLALEIGTSGLKSMYVDLVLDSYDPVKNF